MLGLPGELQVDVVASSLRKAMTVTPGQDQKWPSALDGTIVGTIPFPGTEPYGEILLASVVGAADDLDIELATVPTGEMWVPIAVEGSHNDTTGSRILSLQFRWARAGVTSSLVIGGSQLVLDTFQISAPLERLYFPPASRLALTATFLAAGKKITVRMAYMKRTLGEAIPP